jgi:hypothetical protein
LIEKSITQSAVELKYLILGNFDIEDRLRFLVEDHISLSNLKFSIGRFLKYASHKINLLRVELVEDLQFLIYFFSDSCLDVCLDYATLDLRKILVFEGIKKRVWILLRLNDGFLFCLEEIVRTLFEGSKDCLRYNFLERKIGHLLFSLFIFGLFLIALIDQR